MKKIRVEVRRQLGQFSNLLLHGRFNPFPRCKRKAKPKILKVHPEWEICSPLEFVTTHLQRDHDRPFFVLQIGANDGVHADSIAPLIRKYGWHGLLVEPQPEAYRQLCKNYSDQQQLLLENVAISDQDGTVTMYTFEGATSPLATFNRRVLAQHPQRDGDIVELQIECVTVHTLMRRHNIQHVDLLQIDAEGV